VRVVTPVVLIDAARRAAVADRRRAAGARGGRHEDDATRRACEGEEEDTGRDCVPATAGNPPSVRPRAVAADQRTARRRRSICIPTQARAAAAATTPGGPTGPNRRPVRVASWTALEERHDMIDQRD
jgi:hypothetical protein